MGLYLPPLKKDSPLFGKEGLGEIFGDFIFLLKYFNAIQDTKRYPVSGLDKARGGKNDVLWLIGRESEVRFVPL